MPNLDYQIDPTVKRKTIIDTCACGRPKMERSIRCWQCQTAWPDRFWSRVDKTNGCWLWTGQVDTRGYGVIEFGGKNQKAHRISWEIERGPIADGLTVDHLCLVKNCVRPGHMELVTGGENSRRGAARKTHCKNGHEFTEQNTRYWCRDGYRRRICRACQRANQRKTVWT